MAGRLKGEELESLFQAKAFCDLPRAHTASGSWVSKPNAVQTFENCGSFSRSIWEVAERTNFENVGLGLAVI